MKKNVVFSILLSFIVVFTTACGGGDSAGNGETDSATGSDGGTDSGATVDIVATNWSFDQENYTAPAGEITFHLTNKEGMHGIQIEGTDVNIEGDGSATATLEPGEYQIVCSVVCGAGHADMVSTLTVE